MFIPLARNVRYNHAAVLLLASLIVNLVPAQAGSAAARHPPTQVIPAYT